MKEKRVQKVQKKSSEKKLGEDVFERKKSSESSEKCSEKMFLKGKRVQKVQKKSSEKMYSKGKHSESSKKMKNFRKKVQTMQKKLKVLEDFFGFNKIKIE